MATISRLLQIIGLSCRISSLLKGFFAKETYNFKEPTDRSQPISHHLTLLHFQHSFITGNICKEIL